MITLELYEAERPIAVIEREAGSDLGGWARLQERLARGIVGGSKDRIEVYAEVLLSELGILREIKRLYSTKLVLGKTLQARLRIMADDKREREAAHDSTEEDVGAISRELDLTGFALQLKDFQLRNLSHILALPHAADFSVPGAGKTAVALANFAILRSRQRVERMLVVAPLAAFASWKDEARTCFNDSLNIEVHMGPDATLPTTADILLTNYHRLASDYDRLSLWVAKVPTQVVLDEAHRVKRGRGGIHGRAALDLAFTATRRDVLTGTPAPQGAHDIVALIGFLYPGQEQQILPPDAFVERLGLEQSVLSQTHNAIRRYFVRTRKSELRLPPTRMHVVSRPMGPVQAAIYAGLVGRYRGVFRLEDASRRQLRKYGQIVMYLLEAATNPLLLNAGSDANDLASFGHPPLKLTGDEHLSNLLARYAEYETPWKYQEIIRLVREAADKQEKILVWSSFVRNIRHLEQLLAQWNPAVVHGGIPPLDTASPSAQITREAELDRFRYDPKCTVLLANPAACGEGVSLHRCCHHAVYLDRTFNAGHFLQSQDRIHRLGLPDGTKTLFTLLLSEESIDNTVNHRLRDKIAALGQLMNDPGLVRLALPEDEISGPVEPEVGSTENNIDQGDMHSILQHISPLSQ